MAESEQYGAHEWHVRRFMQGWDQGAVVARTGRRLLTYANVAGLLKELEEARRWRDAFESLAEAVESASSFDAGEALPESSPWAAAFDRLDTALGEIRDGLKAASADA